MPWSNKSAITGFIIGVIITIIIVLLLYYSGAFIFKYCGTKNCSNCDVYNDPGNAIANGYSIDNILLLINGIMFYKAPKQSNNCILTSAVSIRTVTPQYCLFTTNTDEQFEGKNIDFDSPLYTGTLNNVEYEVLAQNCNPIESDPNNVVSGEPLLKWDSTI